MVKKRNEVLALWNYRAPILPLVFLVHFYFLFLPLFSGTLMLCCLSSKAAIIPSFTLNLFFCLLVDAL